MQTLIWKYLKIKWSIILDDGMNFKQTLWSFLRPDKNKIILFILLLLVVVPIVVIGGEGLKEGDEPTYKSALLTHIEVLPFANWMIFISTMGALFLFVLFLPAILAAYILLIMIGALFYLIGMDLDAAWIYQASIYSLCILELWLVACAIVQLASFIRPKNSPKKTRDN